MWAAEPSRRLIRNAQWARLGRFSVLDFGPNHLDHPEPLRVWGTLMRRAQIGERFF